MWLGIIKFAENAYGYNLFQRKFKYYLLIISAEIYMKIQNFSRRQKFYINRVTKNN